MLAQLPKQKKATPRRVAEGCDSPTLGALPTPVTEVLCGGIAGTEAATQAHAHCGGRLSLGTMLRLLGLHDR